MVVDHPITSLLKLMALLLENHDSEIARNTIVELQASSSCAVVKSPQRVAQCNELDGLLSESSTPVLCALESAQHTIHWSASGGASKPEAIQRRLAFAELVGPSGMIWNERCRVGLFLQCAHTAYPVHKHAAEELFLVLSGTAHWQQGSMNACWQAPGAFIHHTSWETHAMTTRAEPLLAAWCWTGDISYEKYEIRDGTIS